MDSYWWALVVGVVAGLVATFLWTFVAHPALRWFERRRRHGWLSGPYRVDRKLEDETVCTDLHVTVAGNILSATSDDFRGTRFDARIALSDELVGSGRGYYSNLKCVSDRIERLWGFIELQVDSEDKTVLVHHSYISHRRIDDAAKVIPRQEFHSAYVWRRQSQAV